MAKVKDDSAAPTPKTYTIGNRTYTLSDSHYGRTLGSVYYGNQEVLELVEILKADNTINYIQFWSKSGSFLSKEANLALAEALTNSTSIIFVQYDIGTQYGFYSSFDIEVRNAIKSNSNILSIADQKVGEPYSICPKKEQAAMALAQQLKDTGIGKISPDLATEIARSAGAVEFLLRTKLGLNRVDAKTRVIHAYISPVLADALPLFSYDLVGVVGDYLLNDFQRPTNAMAFTALMTTLIPTPTQGKTEIVRSAERPNPPLSWREREEARKNQNICKRVTSWLGF